VLNFLLKCRLYLVFPWSFPYNINVHQGITASPNDRLTGKTHTGHPQLRQSYNLLQLLIINIINPAGDEDKDMTFCLDPHVHTIGTSSCGKVNGATVAELYKKAGYDGIVITNHYHEEFFTQFAANLSWQETIDLFLREYHGARAQGNKLGLSVFLGMEIRFTDSPNDFLVYGFDEDFLRTYPNLHHLGLKGFRELVASLAPAYRILIFQAHPFREGLNPAAPDLLDGVEVHNGNPRHNSYNHLAAAFARINQLTMISGSDFHRLTDLARGGILLPHPIETVNEFVAVLMEKRGNTIITNPNLPLGFWRLKAAVLNCSC